LATEIALNSLLTVCVHVKLYEQTNLNITSTVNDKLL